MLFYLWCGFVGRAEISSEEQKHEQVNPLLAGLQHHMEVCQPLVLLDTRYHVSLARWCICCGDLTEKGEHGVKLNSNQMT